ncbi:unnamed protein product [Caenorhabditis auriculariae]|uniref:Selenocysteine lyase n=1 Tax=Caenorhabditis auriculariae TaxID=2777116 RepID=A0A8S1H9D6_9PELO|nr:unnamed protein product [Caenorhabditis auriculariae]
MEPAYFDNNATTPLDPSVMSSMRDAFDLWANPSSNNSNARKTALAISEARREIGKMFQVTSDDVIFTSGGTESNNWVIDSAVRLHKYNKRVGKPHVVTSSIEHPAIKEPLLRRLRDEEIDVTFVEVSPETGAVRVEDVLTAMTSSTCLVTIMLANNETGVLQPVAEIGVSVRSKFGNSVFIHTDAAQAVGKIAISIPDLHVDALTVVGHKFYGPRNGALVLRSRAEVALEPLFLGGNQEFGLRSGTENTPMVVGLGQAARVFNEASEEIEQRLRGTRDYFEAQLKECLGDEHKVHFGASPRLPNTSSVAFLNYEPHSCHLIENCKTFSASTGAACHKSECSPILTACGIPFSIASKTVRFSFGRSTTKEEVDLAVAELVSLTSRSKK